MSTRQIPDGTSQGSKWNRSKCKVVSINPFLILKYEPIRRTLSSWAQCSCPWWITTPGALRWWTETPGTWTLTSTSALCPSCSASPEVQAGNLPLCECFMSHGSIIAKLNSQMRVSRRQQHFTWSTKPHSHPQTCSRRKFCRPWWSLFLARGKVDSWTCWRLCSGEKHFPNDYILVTIAHLTI